MEKVRGVETVIAYPRNNQRQWWESAVWISKTLRPYQFDLAVIANASKELHLGVALSGIPKRVGYSRKWGRFLLTKGIADLRYTGSMHEVESNQELLYKAGLIEKDTPCAYPDFSFDEDVGLPEELKSFLANGKWTLAIHPWSSNPIKQWPIERFEAVITQMSKNPDLQIIVIGGKEHLGGAASRTLLNAEALNCVGRLSLEQLMVVLKQVDTLLSNDSGPVHLAAALGTKTVALFGTSEVSTGPSRWGPWGMGHQVIYRESMQSIRVEDVLDEVQRQFQTVC